MNQNLKGRDLQDKTRQGKTRLFRQMLEGIMKKEMSWQEIKEKRL
jgi:hypothetical protein